MQEKVWVHKTKLFEYGFSQMLMNLLNANWSWKDIKNFLKEKEQ